MKEPTWIDLGYMNGWRDGGMEYRIYYLICKLKYGVEVISHSPRGTDTEYICNEAKVRWHIDSSD